MICDTESKNPRQKMYYGVFNADSPACRATEKAESGLNWYILTISLRNSSISHVHRASDKRSYEHRDRNCNSFHVPHFSHTKECFGTRAIYTPNTGFRYHQACSVLPAASLFSEYPFHTVSRHRRKKNVAARVEWHPYSSFCPS